MSNYAPSPSKKPIYQNLATTSLSEVTASDIQKITDPVKLAAVNQDALIVNNIVNQAAMRNDAGPIPETSRLVKAVVTDTNQVSFGTIAEGEVWQILAATSLANTDPSATITYYLYMRHGIYGSGPPETDFDLYLAAASSASTFVSLGNWFEDLGGNGPFYVDSKCELFADVSSMGSASRFDIYLLMTRIR